MTDLYGFRAGEIQAHRARLERLFSRPMEIHESSYVLEEEYYLLNLPGGERLKLQQNHDAAEGDWAEDDFKEMAVLLFVEARDRAEELRRMLIPGVEGIEFLQRELCTSDRRFLRIRSVGGRDTVVLEKDLADRDLAVRHP